MRECGMESESAVRLFTFFFWDGLGVGNGSW